MHTSDPVINPRPSAPYAGIRMRVPMQFEKFLPKAWQKVAYWLTNGGVAGYGPAIIRYHTTDMANLLEIDVAFAIPTLLPADPSAGIITGELPAGKYACITHTGPYDHEGVYLANGKIVEWAKENHIQWDVETRDGEEWWASRVEWYLSDPGADPDPQSYITQLTFKVRE